MPPSQKSPDSQPVPRPPKRKARILLAAAALFCVALVAAITITVMFPFAQEKLTEQVQRHSSATVEFGSFRKLYFPGPGFIAEGVVLRRASSAPPSVTIKRITVVASYFGLLGRSKSIRQVQTEGLVVRVSTDDGSHNLLFHRGPDTEGTFTVERLVAESSELQISSGPNRKPLLFRVGRLDMQDVGEHSRIKFDVALHNPKPEMTINARGELGPWRRDQVLLTPVSGTFAVSNGNLATLPQLGGLLAGRGHFNGELATIHVTGTAEVSNFVVRRGTHPMPLRTQYDSVVRTSGGEVTLRSVHARLGETEITASGVIAPAERHKPEVVNLLLASDAGRIEDLLRLVVASPKPAMRGPIRFRTRAIVARGEEPFLSRVRLDGEFLIHKAAFTSATQQKVDKLSARAQGNTEDEDPPDTAVTLTGNVEMKDGIALLSKVKFQVRGADAVGGGTFNVFSKRVHLKGRLRTQAKLSEATKGAKSFVLKLLQPIIKNEGGGSVVPVQVTGTSKHPKFKVGIR